MCIGDSNNPPMYFVMLECGIHNPMRIDNKTRPFQHPIHFRIQCTSVYFRLNKNPMLFAFLFDLVFGEMF